jgi:hypothetical protein
MRSLLLPSVLLYLVLSLLPHMASSQDFTGTYSLTNQQGGTVTLTLSQDGARNITGSMVGNGQRYTVDGMVEESAAVGLIYNDLGGVYFEARLTGSQLNLTLIEPDAYNQPDYSRTQQLSLNRQGAGAASAAPGKRSAKQPAGQRQSGAGVRSGGGQGTLLGSWRCQTAEGPAQLQFLSQDQLVYNGERAQYSLVQGAVRVMGEYGPTDYRYSLSGDDLSVTDPYGQSMQCQRQAQGERARAAAGGGGTGMEQLLQGEKCAYSSSPDGGFSTTRRIYFDGNGRFVYGTLSEVGTPEVIGYGQGQGDPGSYRVLGSDRGDEVHLTFDNGSQVVVYVHHVYQGMIMELWYDDMVYAPGLCPGG